MKYAVILVFLLFLGAGVFCAIFAKWRECGSDINSPDITSSSIADGNSVAQVLVADDDHVDLSIFLPSIAMEAVDRQSSMPVVAIPQVEKKELGIIDEYRSEKNPILRQNKLRDWINAATPGLEEVALIALSESDPILVLEGLKVLHGVGKKASVPILLELLESNRKRPDGYGPPICEAIVAALGACGDASVVPVLLKDLNVNQDLSYSTVIVKALGEIGDESALKAIESQITYLNDHKPTQPISMQPWKDAMKIANEALTSISTAKKFIKK